MFSKFALIVFFGTSYVSDDQSGKSMETIEFPYRAECEYAANKINEEVRGAQAFCFDVVVAGDRHESSYEQGALGQTRGIRELSAEATKMLLGN